MGLLHILCATRLEKDNTLSLPREEKVLDPFLKFEIYLKIIVLWRNRLLRSTKVLIRERQPLSSPQQSAL